jgi:hypothetical protein
MSQQNQSYPASLIGPPDELSAAPDLLELCLDLCTPATLAALWHDHTNYLAAHQEETSGERWGAMDLIQQDADLIHAHLTHEHFKGDPTAAQQYLNGIDHIPF